ncbi:NAD-dependent deacetylase sirtuin-7 [Xylaria curta]|nr:NAD-dependent deacetylase sirtuin-7 [Xylaria curta]
MADTAPKVAEAEREELAEVLGKKADALVELIRKSKHFINAPYLTILGIADFRGPNGVWTLRAQGKQAQNRKSIPQAIPTPTHMALVELQKHGILTYLISQNCDCLHRRSGILPNRISELHGNGNREYCQDCGKEYIRDFRAVSTYEKSIHDHRTGRECALCGGPLLDTIINFGENLSEEPLRLALVGGKRGAKLAICKLQSTPIDRLADIRIFAKTDDLMTRVMAKLALPISPFILRRRLVIRVETGTDERQQLVVQGIDVDGTPATFLQSVRLDYNRRVVRSEPFVINFRNHPEPGTRLKLELEFMGHYSEPNLEVEHIYGVVGSPETHYLLEYNPVDGNWTATESKSSHLDHRARNTRIEKVVVDLATD